MATFAPNISWLFPELPFSQRPVVVAKLGFKALEFPISTPLLMHRSATDLK
jgi:hydroxypyruvate isomerase